MSAWHVAIDDTSEVGMDALATEARDRTSEASRVRALSNDGLIIELINTLNHLSRWLTPIHDQNVLDHSPRRSEPSVKELLIRMRDTEAWAYAFMYAIATQTNPDLDRIPHGELSDVRRAADRDTNALVIVSGFRRVRESSTSLLRALPDSAWERGGYSRSRRDWTIRELAEYSAAHDWELLNEIDTTLARTGAREGIAEASRVGYDQLDEVFVSSATRG